MPLKHYGVLKGRPVDRRLGSGRNPHYQVHIVDENRDHRIAVNVRSKLAPSEVAYVIEPRFMHPLTAGLAELPLGFTALSSRPGGLALDFIRGNLFEPWKMVPLPLDVPGPDNDLNEKVDHYIQRAMADEESFVYAFGEPWGPEDVKDKVFGFLPGRGIHDIHMNQGNAGQFSDQDGVWQDGGLILHFPAQEQWVGIFLKFQSQAWHTDDSTGHTLPGGTSGPPSDPHEPEDISEPGHLPSGALPDGMVRIVAALVNSVEDPEQETVTLLNPTPRPIDLTGWMLADRNKNKQPLSGVLSPGSTVRISVAAPVQLSNQGGILSVLNNEGIKVHGVSYTREQARNPGWSVVF